MRGMRRGAIFWGCFLLSLGSAILLFRHDIMHVEWRVIQEYWAVLLILWGVSLLFRESTYRWVISAIFAVLLGFGLAAVLTDHQHTQWTGTGWHFQWHDDDPDSDSSDGDDDDDAGAKKTDTSASKTIVPDSSTSAQTHKDSSKTQHPIY